MKKILFTLPVALASFFASASNVSAGLIQISYQTSAAQTGFAGAVLNNDLVNQGSSSLLSVTESNYTPFRTISTPSAVLNDGSIGPDVSDLNKDGSAFDLDGTFSVTYNLNLANAALGYDLKTIQSFAAHPPSRAGQAYTVSVDFVGDGLGNFVSLGTFDAGGAAGASATMLTLQNNVGSGTTAFASGVGAIRFDIFSSATGAAAAWREIDVVGSITAVPEPSSMLLTLGAGAFVYYRHRRSRKLTAAKSEVA